jgi:chromosome segregation ATPase
MPTLDGGPSIRMAVALVRKAQDLADTLAAQQQLLDSEQAALATAQLDLGAKMVQADATIAQLQTTITTLQDTITELQSIADEAQTAIADSITDRAALHEALDALTARVVALETPPVSVP